MWVVTRVVPSGAVFVLCTLHIVGTVVLQTQQPSCLSPLPPSAHLLPRATQRLQFTNRRPQSGTQPTTHHLTPTTPLPPPTTQRRQSKIQCTTPNTHNNPTVHNPPHTTTTRPKSTTHYLTPTANVTTPTTSTNNPTPALQHPQPPTSVRLSRKMLLLCIKLNCHWNCCWL